MTNNYIHLELYYKISVNEESIQQHGIDEFIVQLKTIQKKVTIAHQNNSCLIKLALSSDPDKHLCQLKTYICSLQMQSNLLYTSATILTSLTLPLRSSLQHLSSRYLAI